MAVFLALVSLLVGCDHATKHLAETELRGSGSVAVVPGVFQLRYAQNHDIAFNLLREVPPEVRMPFIVTAGVVAVFALLFLALRRSSRPMELGAYALLLGGAVGNLADRLARGYVVDFLHLQHWPVFNVADVWVVAGMVLLFLSSRPGPSARSRGTRSEGSAPPPPPIGAAKRLVGGAARSMLRRSRFRWV